MTRQLPGINYQALEGMVRKERLWYLKRIVEVLEAEADALKANRKK